ncbi:hypothetical protein LINPERHAP2_LOCUS17911 [Linum perenne]
MSRKLPQLWAKKGGIQVSDVGFGFYVVNFESVADYERALFGGPWMVNDHYVVIKEWRPHFRPEDTVLSTLRVWVRLPGIPLEYFDRSILQIIGDRIGRTVRIDNTTLEGSRGNFARICVEVDLSKPLLSKYRLRRRVRRIEYEGLHTICFNCGCYGHKDGDCKQMPEAEEIVNQTTSFANPVFQEVVGVDARPEVEEDFGPWMQVKKSRRKPNHRGEVGSSGDRPAKEAKKGNSFSALANLESQADLENHIPRNADQPLININEEPLEEILEGADKEASFIRAEELPVTVGGNAGVQISMELGQASVAQGPSSETVKFRLGLGETVGGNGPSPLTGPGPQPGLANPKSGPFLVTEAENQIPNACSSPIPPKRAPLVSKNSKAPKVKAKASAGVRSSKPKDGSALLESKEWLTAMDVL